MKRDNLEDEPRPISYPDLYSLITFGFFLVLFLVFYYLLSTQVATESFGWKEILMSIALALIASIVLNLASSTMKTNLYLGLAFGLALLVIALTALFNAYKGNYTNIFAIIGSLATLVYLGISFWQNRKVH